ncbi:MAG TPA: hypothetical protein VNT26_04175, partial [Candidatus Sulfotelmatobacter sp.]|nr:hypothetical protein [Candidatus Sulfotelmatobacter sp.]
MQHITRFAGTISQVLIRYKNELLWILAGIALIVPLGYAARLRVDAIADTRQGVVLAADGVVAVGRVPLLAEVPGVVRQVPVKGARVTQGQQLVRLEDPELEAAVVSARLQLEAARTNLTQAGVTAGADPADPNSALQLATLALEAVEKATDTLHSGISAASRPQQTAPAAGNQDRKVTQAQVGPPQSPHHSTSAPVLPMGGHGQKPSTPAPAQAK